MPAKQTRESIEAELGGCSKPIVERMAAIGASQAEIDHVRTWLDALSKIVSGRMDELPDQVKSELAAQADAELSGAEQLAAIVGGNSKKGPFMNDPTRTDSAIGSAAVPISI